MIFVSSKFFMNELIKQVKHYYIKNLNQLFFYFTYCWKHKLGKIRVTILLINNSQWQC